MDTKHEANNEQPDKLPEGAKPGAAAAPRGLTSRDVLTPRVGETYSIKGGSSVTWGVAGTSTLGTVLSHDVDDSAQYEKVENQYGAVTGIVIYDTETVVRLSIIALSTATRPVIGDALTIGLLTGTVLKSSFKAANKQCVKFEVEANKWANLTLA